MIVVNDSYNDAEVRAKLAVLCGPPIGFWKSLRNGGNGLGGFKLTVAPDVCQERFDTLDNLFTNIELRQQGLIVRVKFKTETYAIAFPYTQLEQIEVSRVAFGKSLLKIKTTKDRLEMGFSTSLEREVLARLSNNNAVRTKLREII